MRDIFLQTAVIILRVDSFWVLRDFPLNIQNPSLAAVREGSISSGAYAQ